MEIHVTDQRAELVKPDKLVQNSENLLFVHFTFDDTWDGFDRTAIFSIDSVFSDDVVQCSYSLDEENTCPVPAWFLTGDGKNLQVGVFGVRGETQKPTLWCSVGPADRGAVPGQNLPDLPPNLQDQLFSEIQSLRETVDRLSSSASGGTADHAQLSNRDAADQHPIRAITGLDGTVSDLGNSLSELEGTVSDLGNSLFGKIPTDQKGVAGGVATLGEDGRVPNAQLPPIPSGVPVGTILSVMGNHPPDGYLVCDGAQYQTADYPALSSWFSAQFGASNHFGGDGAATFAVPDLRGEFLRGAGTNSNPSCGSGSAVGEHQSPTKIPRVCQHPVGTSFIFQTVCGDERGEVLNQPNQTDSNISILVENTNTVRNFNGASLSDNGGNVGSTFVAKYTVRPTNTSILFCVKY